MSNVTALPQVDADDLRANVEKMKRNFETMAEAQGVLMKLRKAAYDAAIDEGFTPDQALDLCKKAV